MTRRKDHTVRNPLSHAELNVGQKRESDAQRNDDGFHPETLSKFHNNNKTANLKSGTKGFRLFGILGLAGREDGEIVCTVLGMYVSEATRDDGRRRLAWRESNWRVVVVRHGIVAYS
jgi:hypothetical protein